MCPFLVHAPSTLLAPGRRCVLRPFGHRRRKGVWLITLPATEWASKLPRRWTCRHDLRAEALALERHDRSPLPDMKTSGHDLSFPHALAAVCQSVSFHLGKPTATAARGRVAAAFLGRASGPGARQSRASPVARQGVPGRPGTPSARRQSAGFGARNPIPRFGFGMKSGGGGI